MCRNSCCLFSGDRADLTHCDFCYTPRRHPNGKPACRFSYLPLIPRLKGWFKSPEMIKRMAYRQNYEYVEGEVSDVFDGEHYRSKCCEYVVIDGEDLKHKFFSDPRDIALGACIN